MYGSKDFEGIWWFITVMVFIGILATLGLVGWGLWSLIKFIF
jgi:hypothetical protein